MTCGPKRARRIEHVLDAVEQRNTNDGEALTRASAASSPVDFVVTIRMSQSESSCVRVVGVNGEITESDAAQGESPVR